MNNLILRTTNSPYGDTNKGSVLSQNELDNNFIYLKEQLIYTATTNGNILTLSKINGSSIDVTIPSSSSSGSTVYSNGLTNVSGTTKLGGTLVNNTTIGGLFDFNIDTVKSFKIGVATGLTNGDFSIDTGIISQHVNSNVSNFTETSDSTTGIYSLNITNNNGKSIDNSLYTLGGYCGLSWVINNRYQFTISDVEGLKYDDLNSTPLFFIDRNTGKVTINRYSFTGSTGSSLTHILGINQSGDIIDIGPISGGTFNQYFISGTSGLNSVKAVNSSSIDATGNLSMAIGDSTLASGDYSYAGGYQSIASGIRSFSFGSASTAMSDSSLSIGVNTLSNASEIVNLQTPIIVLSSITITMNDPNNSMPAVVLPNDVTSEWGVYLGDFCSEFLLSNGFGITQLINVGCSYDDFYYDSGTNSTYIVDASISASSYNTISGATFAFIDTYFSRPAMSFGTNTKAFGVNSFSEGYNNVASKYATHAEGRDNYAGASGFRASTILNGLITLDSSYGNISSAFTADDLTFILDRDFGLELGCVLLTISSITYTTNTLIQLYDTTINNSIGCYVGNINNINDKSADVVFGNYSHVEGLSNKTFGPASHAEGQSTIASGDNSHAEGNGTKSIGISSHSEGTSTTASGDYSHAGGYQTIARGQSSHAEGNSTMAIGSSSHAEGLSTTSFGSSSHSEGSGTITSGTSAHAEGNLTVARGDNSHAEGTNTLAAGIASHAEGNATTASGSSSHAEGYLTIASGNFGSHAEGYQTTTSGESAHAEGRNTTASGSGSHAEGNGTTASGDYSHAEGNLTVATIIAAHAEGSETTASGVGSHAEGLGTTASGIASHAEGFITIARGNQSHAGGYQSIASGTTSFVHGSASTATGSGTIVLGNGITGTTDNTVYVPNFVLKKVAVPTTSGDAIGENGSITWDNNYFYWKANGQWLRISGSTF